MMTHLGLMRFGTAVAFVMAIPASALLAAAPAGLDNPPVNTAAPVIEILPDKPRIATAPPSGNPLWAIPISMLSATRERPIFLPSRRPPAPVIASPRPAPAGAPKAAPPAEPTRPPLALVGAVVGESDAIAIFVDQTTRNVVRLKTGQDHGGWVLNSVKPREATLQKNDLTAVFALPVPNAPSLASAPVGSIPGPLAVPAGSAGPVVVPTNGDAPFVPRSTPKNGEPDGL
jgi:general secretion pathway protein N